MTDAIYAFDMLVARRGHAEAAYELAQIQPLGLLARRVDEGVPVQLRTGQDRIGSVHACLMGLEG